LAKNVLDLVDMKVLTIEKIKLIHNASLTLLEEVGVKVYNDEALELLDGIGAYVKNNNLVRIPSYLVERAVRTAPKRITLYDQKGQSSMVLEDGKIYFGSNIDCLKYLDPYSDRTMKLTSQHAKALAKIGDYLPNISFIYSVGLLADYDVRLGSRIAFSTALQNTSKPINFTTNDSDSCKDIIELASLIAGGKKELREKPFIFHYCEPIPPLSHDNESLQKVFYCAQAGVPVVYMPYCLMGGTAPVTLAGALAQTNAEILSGLVIHQAKKEGAPFIIGSMPSTMDMRTTIGTYGTPEFHLQIAASAELANFYGLPFYGTAGCSDAKSIDYQAVSEVTMNCLTSLLSKANLVHDIGFLDHANILSPELVVLVDEILSMLKVIRRGIHVDKETLALDVIKQVGPGGHYMTHNHTFKHFREIWYSDIMDRTIGEKVPTANQKIKHKTKEIIEKHQPETTFNDKSKLIKEIEEDWIKSIK
jgi:trimethylamine--corrinoid protein Co-methyltransferase